MPSMEKCKKRGVKIRIAAPVTKNNANIAKDLKKVAEVRNIGGMKARFIIIDSTQIMFMLLDDEKFHPNYDIGVWINTEFFARTLEQLFELACFLFLLSFRYYKVYSVQFPFLESCFVYSLTSRRQPRR